MISFCESIVRRSSTSEFSASVSSVSEIRPRSLVADHMDLQDFVTTTLCQISAGVATAKNYDRCIAPRIAIREDNPTMLRTLADADGVFLVEFDVPVAASAATEKGTAVSITVPSARAKGQAKRSIENSYVSRIKFSVPINYR
jgi:hypothetical protein